MSENVWTDFSQSGTCMVWNKLVYELLYSFYYTAGIFNTSGYKKWLEMTIILVYGRYKAQWNMYSSLFCCDECQKFVSSMAWGQWHKPFSKLFLFLGWSICIWGDQLWIYFFKVTHYFNKQYLVIVPGNIIKLNFDVGLAPWLVEQSVEYIWYPSGDAFICTCQKDWWFHTAFGTLDWVWMYNIT